MKKVFQGFKDFVLQGSALDLAVGVVIGAAFAAFVDALVNYLISPIIGAIFGQPDLSRLWDITLRGDSVISVGGLLDALLTLLIIAAALYFIVVLPVNRINERLKAGQEEPEEVKPDDVVLLAEIRDLLAQK